MERWWARGVAAGTVALLACGLGTLGTGSNGDFGADASLDAIPPPPVGTRSDSSFDLPVEPDAATPADAAPVTDASSVVDAFVCGSVGTRCASQSACCPQTFCGRRYYNDPYECRACQQDGRSCGSNVECCSRKCEWQWVGYYWDQRCAR